MELIKVMRLWTIDTLFPVRCVGCGETDKILCDNCLKKIVPIKQQQCVRCLANSDNGKTCRSCKKYMSIDHLLVSCYYHEGPLKEAVHNFKYNFRTDMASYIVNLLVGSPMIDELLSAINLRAKTHNVIIIPVPLYRSRKWWRGFNQSEIIAKGLSNTLRVPIKSNILRRQKPTASQVGLHRKERILNLSDAFTVNPKLRLEGEHIILVDDIATTGSTLHYCARALKKAGAARVYGVVVARAI